MEHLLEYMVVIRVGLHPFLVLVTASLPMETFMVLLSGGRDRGGGANWIRNLPDINFCET